MTGVGTDAATETDGDMQVERDDKTMIRVLLIDDQEELLTIVARLIRSLGHSCIACREPEQVRDILRENAAQLDVVITDYSMPGVSGGQVIEMCGKDYPHLVTFLSTGHDEADAEALARGKGADGVLPKPLTRDALTKALEGVVNSVRPDARPGQRAAIG